MAEDATMIISGERQIGYPDTPGRPRDFAPSVCASARPSP
jgi:hypothetical protein